MRVASALFVVLLACGDDEGATRDAGIDATPEAGALDASEREEPTPPSPPILTPCPGGWREQDGACEPMPEVDPATCASDESIFPGDAGCTPIGTPCGDDDWATDLPVGGTILYVAPGGGGAGTRDAPFGTIGDALAGAGDGDVIALAKGTYAEALRLRTGVTLWGACVAETNLVAPSPDTSEATVTVLGERVTIENVRITGDRGAVWLVGTGREVTLEGVLAEGAWVAAIAVTDGAVARGHGLVVRGTRAAADGRFGQGFSIQGGTLELSRAVVEANRQTGVSIDAGGDVTLSDVSVRGTLPEEASGSFGRGINVQEASTLVLARVVIEGNREVSVFVSGGSTVEASDLVVRDTVYDVAWTSGDGVQVRNGSSVELRRARLERNVRVSVAVADEGSRLVLEDALVLDSLADPDGFYGQGILVTGGPVQLEARRVVVARARHVGVAVEDPCEVALSDLEVRETLGQPADEAFGRGLSVQAGASVTVERARFADNHDVGVQATGEGTSVTLTDVEVRDTAPRPCAESTCSEAPGGVGIGAYASAGLQARRFRVARAALAGVQVARDGGLDLSEGEIAECPVGANVQVDGFDLDRLTNGVAYRDNERNLDSVGLPVPEPEVPLDL